MTVLGDQMRALAATGHTKADDLRGKAQALDDASAGFYGEPQTVDARRFLGCWARARRLWADCTGDDLA